MNLRLKNIRGRHLGLCVVLAAMVTGLSGCGSGGGSSSTPTPVANADPTGYYDVTGTASVVDVSGTTLNITDMEAMVSNKHMMMFSATAYLQYDITITNISGNSFTGNAKIYYMTIPTLLKSTESNTTTTVSGTITQGSSITGTIAGSGIGSGTFDLVYNSQTAALPTATTSWSGLLYGTASTDIFGFATDVTGTITSVGYQPTTNYFQYCIPDTGSSLTKISNTNLYAITLVLKSCSHRVLNTTYTGLASLKDLTASALNFAVVSADGNYGISGDLSKQ